MDWYLDKTLTWTNSLTYRKSDGANPINDYLYNYETNNDFVRNRFNDQYTNTNDVEYSTNFTKNSKKKAINYMLKQQYHEILIMIPQNYGCYCRRC